MEPYYKNKNCKLYQCDNLDLLKSMKDNYIDLIYCDILYNTGRKFNDYDDNLGTTQEAIAWYEPRLIEMKRVLKETGSIYLHCDFHLCHYLKIKMDEIFGINNFRDEIIWHYNSTNRSKNDFPKKHDNLLLYSKSKNYTYIPEYEPYADTVFSGRYGKDDDGYFNTVNGKKYYINPNGKMIDDVWDIGIIGQRSYERTNYDTQKPKKLLERIIKTTSNNENIVADFFMGSGTTGEVSVELGRRFIGCDIGDKACKITKERLEKLITP